MSVHVTFWIPFMSGSQPSAVAPGVPPVMSAHSPPFTLRRSLMPYTYDFDASTVTRTDCSDSFTAFTATGAAGVV